MKFYAEYQNIEKTELIGVLVVDEAFCVTENSITYYNKCYGVTNPPYTMLGPTVSIAQGYPEDYCTEVTEIQARELHPQLFTYLEIQGILSPKAAS